MLGGAAAAGSFQLDLISVHWKNYIMHGLISGAHRPCLCVLKLARKESVNENKEQGKERHLVEPDRQLVDRIRMGFVWRI